MRIRIATDQDRDRVRGIHLAAFPDSERDLVADLAERLLCEPTLPPAVSLIAETDDGVAGHVAFSPVWSEDDREMNGYILAPLGVHPESQKRGVGLGLVEAGMQRLKAAGVQVVFVYGDPAYYGRFGFSVESAAGYVPPYALQYPHGWQACELSEVGGERREVRVTCVDALCDPELW